MTLSSATAKRSLPTATAKRSTKNTTHWKRRLNILLRADSGHKVGVWRQNVTEEGNVAPFSESQTERTGIYDEHGDCLGHEIIAVDIHGAAETRRATAPLGSGGFYIAIQSCPLARSSGARWTEEEILLLASFNRFLLRSSQECCQKSACSCEGQPQPRNGSVPGEMNQIGADCGRKSAEDSGGQAIGEGET